jgi:beta-glucosidase
VLDALREAAPALDVRHAAGGEQAGAAAAAADAVLVVVGEPSSLSGEASSRADLRLPREQEELIARIAAAGRPFAVVLIAGRPLVVEPWIDLAPCVLLAWHGGLEAGPALADVLLGDVPPGGKLPVTLPRSVGQLPLSYDHERTGRPAGPDQPPSSFTSGYLDLADGPRFPFGHGLSYTRFAISAPRCTTPRVSVAELAAGRRVEVTAEVRNTGDRAGDEVVQLYVHDPVASQVQPVRRLRGFERVSLAPGESAPVRFTLGADDLGFFTADGTEPTVEPGRVEVYVGADSRASSRLDLTLTD